MRNTGKRQSTGIRNALPAKRTNNASTIFQNNNWQITYLDTFTLLLTFFIISHGLSQVELLPLDMSGLGLRSPIEGMAKTDHLIGELMHDLEQLLQEEISRGQLLLEADDRELRLHFRGSSFYRVAEAELLPGGKAIINRILETTAMLQFYDFSIDVEGHADSSPINTPVYPSNWELSMARAANIVKYFIETGFDPVKLKGSGYGDTFPVAPNTDAFGIPIPENQDMNRRVVIRLYY